MTFGQRAAYDRISKLWSEAPAPTRKRHVSVSDAGEHVGPTARVASWGDWQPGDEQWCDVSAVLPRARAWFAAMVGGVAAVVLVVWAVVT